MDSSAHKANNSMTKTTPNMFSSAPDKVTRAEVMFAFSIAEHNLPMAVAVHFTELVKEMFPDSEIAKKFSRKRSKTRHILYTVLAPALDDRVTSLCKSEKFSLMIDESNDHSDNKAVTILVHVLDRTVQQITTRFLDLPMCNIGMRASPFSCLNEVIM